MPIRGSYGMVTITVSASWNPPRIKGNWRIYYLIQAFSQGFFLDKHFSYLSYGIISRQLLWQPLHFPQKKHHPNRCNCNPLFAMNSLGFPATFPSSRYHHLSDSIHPRGVKVTRFSLTCPSGLEVIHLELISMKWYNFERSPNGVMDHSWQTSMKFWSNIAMKRYELESFCWRFWPPSDFHWQTWGPCWTLSVFFWQFPTKTPNQMGFFPTTFLTFLSAVFKYKQVVDWGLPRF